MEQKENPKRDRKFCTVCRRYTNHSLLKSFVGMRVGPFNVINDGVPNVSESYFVTLWLIWSCDGCDDLLLEDGTFLSPEDDDDPIGRMDSEYYPPVTRTNRPKKTFQKIPPKLELIYKEAHGAFQNGLDILCAMGLRSLIEGICDDKGISGNHDKLDKKINSLTKLGMPAGMIEKLHSFRFMGNKAVHELTAPDSDDLQIAIEIVEDILNYFYDLDYKLTLLSQRQRKGPKFLVGNEGAAQSEAG